MTPAERAIPQPGAAPGLPDTTASLANLAIDTTDYVRAWSALFASEARLAGISMVRLAIGAIVAPAVALVVCVSVDALLATLLQRWWGDWAASTGAVVVFNIAAFVGLLYAMRRWWRNLSLPRSRNALSHLLERLA
jgi:hypothetical protein